MKKTVAILLTAALLLCAAPLAGFTAIQLPQIGSLSGVFAKAQEEHVPIVDKGSCGENVLWTLNKKGLLTVSGKGLMENYDLKTKDLTCYSTAPWDAAAVKEVVIEDGVTSVGQYAFYGCGNLSSIQFGADVGSMWLGAFAECDSLPTVVIPDNITRLGEGAFLGCDGLASVVIGDGLHTAGPFAFKDCPVLTELTIGRSIERVTVCDLGICTEVLKTVTVTKETESLADSAFYGYEAITAISLPDTLTSIGDKAFGFCRSLPHLDIPEKVTSIGNEAFRFCSSLDAVVIPDGVPTVGDFAFAGCVSLVSAQLPPSLTSIHQSAFECCESLESIEIPDNVTSIGDRAFWNCSSLRNVAIGDGVAFVGCSVFEACCAITSLAIGRPIEKLTLCDFSIPQGSLQTVNVTYGVRSLTCGAFYKYTNIVAVSLPITLTSIGASAFEKCVSLSVINLPPFLTHIGEAAFRTNYSMQTLVLPDSVTSLEKEAFRGCSALAFVSTGNGIKSIDEGVFRECDALGTVLLGEKVESIGERAFEDCVSLPCINMPRGVTSVWNHAFAGCKSLKTVMLSDTMTNISEYAFYGCCSLVFIGIPDSIKYIGLSAFDLCLKLNKLCYAGSKAQWKEIDNRSARCPDYYDCLFVDGIVYDRDKTKLQTVYDDSLVSVNVLYGVEEICKKAFDGCGALTEIYFPLTVTTIRESAFADCGALSDVYYEGSEARWKDVTIKKKNDPVTKQATIHFDVHMHTPARDAEYEILVAPTCAAPGHGEATFHCVVCGETYKETYTISELEHTWDKGVLVTAATETEEGSILFTCAKCGATKTKTIEKLLPPPDYIDGWVGDVDGDGTISAADARLALRASVGLEEDITTGTAKFYFCDADGDGVVSSADARQILLASVGLVDASKWGR